MEDGVDSNADFLETKTNETTGRTRSASTGSNGGGHKRSFSGSLLSRLSFLRMNQVNEESGVVGKGEEEGDGMGADEIGRVGAGAGGGAGGGTPSTATQRRQSLKKTRRRKGSLRKTALLGPGGLRWEGREKRGVASRSLEISADDDANTHDGHNDDDGYGSHVDGHSQFAIDSMSSASTPRAQHSGWPLLNTAEKPIHEQGPLAAGQGFTHHSTAVNNNDINNIDSLGHLSTNTNTNTASTTSLNSLNDNTTSTTASSSIMSGHRIPTPSSSSESYYSHHNNNNPNPTATTNMSLRPRPSLPAHHHRPKSPLATHTVEGVPPPTEIWDYSETEWWGWIILLVTWIVFVVGMGSCFEVWSWAWDVGETPYAPPELEDDPTLPIVGYYPALIILTAVMAWVWVVVAWVGMKYFRHANISGEES